MIEYRQTAVIVRFHCHVNSVARTRPAAKSNAFWRGNVVGLTSILDQGQFFLSLSTITKATGPPQSHLGRARRHPHVGECTDRQTDRPTDRWSRRMFRNMNAPLAMLIDSDALITAN